MRSLVETADAARPVLGTARRAIVDAASGTIRWLAPHARAVAAAGTHLDRETWVVSRAAARWASAAARRDLRAAGWLAGWSGRTLWLTGERHGRWLLLRLGELGWATPGALRRTGRRLAGVGGHRVVRGAGLAALVLAVGAWTLIEPALRLGADLVAHEVDAEGLAPLDQPSLVLGADGTVLTALPGGPNRDAVALDDVPETLVRMVIAVEDARFWDHGGWDREGMVRAAVANVRAGGVEEGGSTISQQLAKQNFAGTERTFVRKAREVLYAVALEERYEKRQLLERYLNEVYLGSRAYGVAAAADEYFGVRLADLTPDQAALLVGLIRSPGALDPRSNPDAARNRRDLVLRVAADHGILTRAEAAAHQAVPLELAPRRSRVTDPMLAEAVRRELLDDPALGDTPEERAEALATGGLRIETGIHPHLQAAARHAVAEGVAAWPGLGGALAAVHPESGQVQALASVTPPGTEAFDVATQGRRQPGSTFKPLAAVAALEAGLDPDERLAGDGPVAFEHLPGEHWTVDNYGGADPGRVALHDALVSSVNTAFAQLALATGTDRIADVADRLGIDVEAALGTPDQRGPSVALGALHRGVSPLEMASAYSVFATGGQRVEPVLVTRILDPDGRPVLEREPEPVDAVDPGVVGTVTPMLQDAVDDGTGTAARLPGWQPAGKTGTTQQHADAWFAGVVPGLAAASWLGHPDGSQSVPGLTGGRAAAPVWQAFMAAALAETPPVPFPELPVLGDPLGDPLDLPDPERPPRS
jgi:penicillin-binding protein 1A